jgi:UDP-glucose:(heptosyl)LPS alpha-1,3-glucosyltransferase
MMKIGLSFPGCHRRGGVERVVFECAQFLSQRGHEVSVFANEYEGVKNVRFHPVKSGVEPFFLKGAGYFLRSTKQTSTADISVLGTHGAVCPTGGVHWVQSVHKAWLARSRTFRGRFSISRIKQSINPLHPVLLNLEEQHFRSRAYRRLIATTPEIRRDLHDLYGVPEADVDIIPNGFSPVEFNPYRRAVLRAEMRRRLSLRADEIALLFAANELERKGYRTVILALKALQPTPFRLIVVGRPSIEAVQKQAVAAGVKDLVIACGSTNEIAHYHAAADAFVLPTQYEAFSLAILEALGSGLPVITSNVPGARDAIQHGKNGLLLQDPNDPEELAETLRQTTPARLRGMSEAAPDTVIHYQWPRVLTRYEAVLQKHCA